MLSQFYKSLIYKYAKDGRIQAGILRDFCGIDVPDNIPAVASTNINDIIIYDEACEYKDNDGLATFNAVIKTGKFEWITVNMVFKPEDKEVSYSLNVMD